MKLEDGLHSFGAKPFFKRVFDGLIVMDSMDGDDFKYGYFRVDYVGWFKVPINIVPYFSIVKIRVDEQRAIYKLRKYRFTQKINKVSMNNEFLFSTDEQRNYLRFDMVVSENQKVYSDTFVLGLKLSYFYGFKLTSCFKLGKVFFSGITWVRSFKRQVKAWNLDYKLL